MTLGERVQVKRKEAGLTQRQLADAAEVTQAAVSDWENDKATPTIAKVGALAKALKVDLSWLVYGEDPADAPEPVAVAKAAS